MSWLSREAMTAMGFAEIGEDVRLSDRASYYNCGNIRIGNHVRIDDFCVLSAGDGGIVIGDYVHIAVYCSLIGHGRIEMRDFSGLSSRVAIYSSNDDYTGRFLTNPTVPEEFTGVTHANVLMCKHTIVGAGAIVLPGVVLAEGAAVGALSLVTKDCEAFSIYTGVPAKRIMKRRDDLLALEAKLREGSG
jgi:galactoside O-acetyltransferase